MIEDMNARKLCAGHAAGIRSPANSAPNQTGRNGREPRLRRLALAALLLVVARRVMKARPTNCSYSNGLCERFGRAW